MLNLFDGKGPLSAFRYNYYETVVVEPVEGGPPMAASCPCNSDLLQWLGDAIINIPYNIWFVRSLLFKYVVAITVLIWLRGSRVERTFVHAVIIR